MSSWSRSAALVLAGGALLGSAGTAAAYAPAGATPLGVGWLRVAVGAATLVAVVPWLGGSWPNLARLARRRSFWVMAAGTAAYQPLFFGAIARSGVAITTLLAVGAVPVFAGAVGWAALAHRPSGRWVTATVIAVTGLALRSSGQLALGDDLGVVMALTAAFAVGCYVVAAKAEIDRGTHPAELAAVAYSLGAAMLAPFALTQPLAWAATPRGLAVALYLGLMTMGVGNLCTIRGMRGLPPGPTSTLLLSDPLVATLLGLVLLHEHLPLIGAVGSLLVLAGIVLQTRAPAPHPAPAALVGAGPER